MYKLELLLYSYKPQGRHMTIRTATPEEYNVIKRDYLSQRFNTVTTEEFERHWSTNDHVAIAESVKSPHHEYMGDVAIILWEGSPAFLTSMIHKKNKWIIAAEA